MVVDSETYDETTANKKEFNIMNNTYVLNEIAKVFSGNGGCIKLGILAIAFLGVAGEFIDRNYGFDTGGSKFKISPIAVPVIDEVNQSPELTTIKKPSKQEVHEVPR